MKQHKVYRVLGVIDVTIEWIITTGVIASAAMLLAAVADFQILNTFVARLLLG